MEVPEGKEDPDPRARAYAREARRLAGASLRLRRFGSAAGDEAAAAAVSLTYGGVFSGFARGSLTYSGVR